MLIAPTAFAIESSAIDTSAVSDDGNDTASGGDGEDSSSEVNDDRLPDLVVYATRVVPGVQRLTGQALSGMARSDLAEALSIIPSVRVVDSASSSLQQGDIKPSEFSIRGAAPYQNKLTLDGASIDSLLDPGNKQPASSQTPSRTQLEGHSQGLFVDPGFLDSLEVIDINARASEGGFVGGVVKAETRRYEGEDAFEISYRRTADNWTQFHVDKDQRDEFEDGAGQYPTGTPGEYQPDFKKSQAAVSGATRVGDVGLFAGVSEKRSRISQKQLVAMDLEQLIETGKAFKATGNRSLDSHSRYATLRADALETDYDLSATLAYSDYSDDSFLINYLDSDYKSNSDGMTLSVNFADDIGDSRLKLNTNLGISRNQRESQRDDLNNYKGRNLYQGAIIGGLGDLTNQQRSLGSDLEVSTPLSPSQTLNYGGEMKWTYFKQQRDSSFTERTYNPVGNTYSDTPYSDHYLYEEYRYRPGSVSFNSLNAALFAELDGEQGRFFWRPGLRIERDDWLGNTNIAPRLMAGMHLDSEQRYQLRLGANRYYGKSFLSYRLREKERELLSIRRRASKDPDAGFVSVDPDDEWQYRDLDTPYDDEFSVGVYGPVWRGEAGLQAVLRQGEDQIRTRVDPDSDLRWYANTGSSKTKQIDLYWHSDPLTWGESTWHINAALSWMDKETDARFDDANGGYNGTQQPNEDVIYKGKRIARNQLPADDYAVPITAGVDVVTQLFNELVTITNGLAITDGYKYLNRTGTDGATGLDRYEVERQGHTLRWDLSVEARLLDSKASPYLRADVLNVTNSENVVSAENGVQLFSLGRQLWLEVGYRF
ncbi:MAG: TonB-dependent receptor plug domain-containing protein [Halomonas sp.]|uniref:TonB-dependent receptor plug domain-containing protein n=1 Tax=Halomonas sp. TaxID=1486246 RepID=UPI003F932C82